MATKTSTAVDTANQWMPREQQLGVENLQGIKGVSGQAPMGDVGNASFSTGLANLTSALGTYLDNRDKQFQAEMAQGAKNILARASEKDLQTLNSIEIATKYGYATLVDNPYFHAYTDSLIGEHNANLAYTDYNTLFADRPARTPEEEAERFDQFMNDRANAYLSTKPQTNATAFQEGFATKKHDVFQGMMQDRSTKEVQDKVALAQATIATDFQNINYNAANKDPEELIQQYQEVIDKSRMIAMQPQFLYKMISSIPMYLAQYGRLNTNQIKTIMDRLQVETRLDGTTATAGQFVSEGDYAPMAVKWQQAHTTQFKLDLANKYKNDSNLDRMKADIAKLYQSKNPADINTAQIMETVLPTVNQAIEQRKAAERARMQAMAKAGGKQAQQQADEALWRANIENVLNGQGNVADIFGNTEGSVRRRDGQPASTAVRDRLLMEYLGNTLADDNMSYEDRLKRATQLLSYSGADNIKSTYANRLTIDMGNLSNEDLSNGVVPDRYINMFNMYKADPSQFRQVFGDTIANVWTTINEGANASGYGGTNGLCQGIMQWKSTRSVNGDQEKSFMDDFDNYKQMQIDEYGSSQTASGVLRLGTDDRMDINIADAVKKSPSLKQRYIALRRGGATTESAIDQLGNEIRDNYTYKYGALFPDSFYTDVAGQVDTSNYDSGQIQQVASDAIDYIISDYADIPSEEVNGDRFDMSYDEASDTLNVNDTYQGSSYSISRSEMLNTMVYIIQNS